MTCIICRYVFKECERLWRKYFEISKSFIGIISVLTVTIISGITMVCLIPVIKKIFKKSVNKDEQLTSATSIEFETTDFDQ